MDTFLTIAISALIGFYIGGACVIAYLLHWLDNHENWR